MTSSLDLNLLLLARTGGSEINELPDLFAVTPPRRAAHGREEDSLIIYLSMVGNSPLSTRAHAQLLEQLTTKFYKTTGSLTSALRSVAENLNMYLLDRNLRSTSVGQQGIGQLILVALRADTLYITQCGAVHAFLVTPQETQHLHDPQSSGRGLGFSRTTPMRFLQMKMNPDDYLVLSTLAAPGWTDSTIRHPQRQGIEAVRRQLLDSGGQEFNSVIVQAQAGTGKLRLLKRKTETPDMANPPMMAQPTSEETAITPTLASGTFGMPTEDKRLGLPSSAVPPTGSIGQPVEDRKLRIPISSPEPVITGAVAATTTSPRQVGSTPIPAQPNGQPPIQEEMASNPSMAPAQTGHPIGSTPKSTLPSPEPAQAKKDSQPGRGSKFLTSFRIILAAIGASILRALRSSLATISAALLRLLKNLLPDADVLRLPPSMMVFIAIAIPLVLATIGGVVFLQRGRAQQHQIYYEKAVEKASYAVSLTNPVEQRMAWQNALSDLNKAEGYTITSESQDLRTQIITNLDNLDAIKRLDYQQAIVGGLDSGVSVSRMVATATDLYLLNQAEGNVLRAIMTGRGYEIDPSFQCGPTYGPVNVGPLVDIAELPPGSFENASLLAMDNNGNLLYCVVGSQPYSAAMAPPNTGFGLPIGMTLDRSDLYVLDPKVNAVWIYRNLEVTEPPRLFFGDTIPQMEDVIDLAVYNDELYLLHADGQMTKCTYSGLAESPTHCDDPYPYSDNRPGKIHGPTIEDTIFSQIYFLSFPERSIYLLDPQNQSIFYFSVLLNLQSQYQPKEPIAEGDATAFAISPNRTAFLAIRNYVYYAAMP
jgi:hypothetical protein